jgi:hypothetical protein
MTPGQAVNEIQTIISKMIEVGLSNQQNYPSTRKVGHNTEIGIAGAPSFSVSMKDRPYTEIYDELDKARAYHLKMIDGALLQMCYRFEKRTITAHRLCVFPAPYLEQFDTDPESYDKDELYADIVGKSIVHVPIRFDFDASDNKHVDVKHPKSHLTLGQYLNCRIPVNAPVSPARFIKFVLRNFYYTAFHAGNLETIDSTFKFGETLTGAERAITHVAC